MMIYLLRSRIEYQWAVLVLVFCLILLSSEAYAGGGKSGKSVFKLPDFKSTVRSMRGSIWLPDKTLIPIALAEPIATKNVNEYSFQLQIPSSRTEDFWRVDWSKTRKAVEPQNQTEKLIYAGEVKLAMFSHRFNGLTRGKNGLIRWFEGIFSSDGTMVCGSTWIIDESNSSTAPPDRVLWWATLESNGNISPIDRVDLNLATVGQLEELGISIMGARSVVEGRLLLKTFKSIAVVLKGPDLTARDKQIIRSRCVVE